MRLCQSRTEVYQKSSSIVPRTNVDGPYAESCKTLQTLQHLVDIFLGEFDLGLDQIFDNGSERHSLGYGFLVVFVWPIPCCDVEFLLEVRLFCCRQREKAKTTDGDLAIQAFFRYPSIRSAFVVEGIFVGMKKTRSNFLLLLFK